MIPTAASTRAATAATSKLAGSASKISAEASSSSTSASKKSRGAFIVFEGVDRCGKTTQVGLLVKHLITIGIAAVALRFPDRTTLIGQMINSYLQQEMEQDDHSIHLLFSANRWEVAPTLRQHLEEGTTVICDRYAYSGVAFSSAKLAADSEAESSSSGSNPPPPLSLEWCQGPDVGLPAPDAVIFLDLSQDEAAKRGGYGGERYEKRELQLRVRKRFAELQELDETQTGTPKWHVLNAAQSIGDVQKDINQIIQETIASVQDSDKSLLAMWPNVGKS